MVITALAAGFISGTSAGIGFTAIISGIIAACVAYASYGHHSPTALSRSILFGTFFLLVGSLSVLSTGIPWLAALSMAMMAFVTSLLTTNIPLGLSSALLGTTAYVLLVGFSLLFMKDQGVNIPLMMLSVIIGVIVGVLVTMIISMVLARMPRRRIPAATHTITLSSVWHTALASTKEFRRAPRDGVRRAIALGIAMFIFQSVPAHDGYLLLVTTAIVLPVYGRVALMTVGARLLGSFMAIGIALILPFVLPRPFVSVIAIAVIAYAITTSLRSTTNSLAASCIGFLLLIGAPGAEIGIYAGWRLIDAAGGFLIAWLCGYVLWPRQPLAITPIPTDLHHECEAVQPVLTART